MVLNQLDTIIQTAMRELVVIIMQVIIISTLCAEMNGPNHTNPNVFGKYAVDKFPFCIVLCETAQEQLQLRKGCGVAQFVAHRLAVRQARVRRMPSAERMQ